jgi:hypothetical protein
MNTMELMAGDVFLMEGTSKLSPALVAAQKTRFYKNARSSHVMFSFGDGVFVHSTLGAGVEFTPYLAALKGCKDDWRVIRNPLITADQKELMQKASIYFVDQAYNKKFLFKSNNHSSFCSELVAKIYKKAGVPLFGKETGEVTPSDFDRAADLGDSWVDVTQIYKDGFSENDKNPRMFAIAYATLVASVRKRQVMLSRTDEIFEMLKGFVSEESYKKLYEMEADFRNKKNISFWNEKAYPQPASASKDGDSSDSEETK